jgi:hypothetical protein
VHFLKSGIVTCCVLLLAACQALRDEADVGSVSVRGVAPTLEHLNISKDTAAQDAFVNDLIRKAGLDYTPRPGDYSWGFVAEAGIYEIGRQCDQYLDVLFRFNRNQRAIRQGLTATGAATASILGVAGVVAMPIAITAVAFGLAASLYDAGVNSVLFTIEPSALRNVVLKGRQAYIRRLDLSKVNSRPRLLIAMQGYLTQCSPATIEANVNNAASGAESVVTMRPGASADGAILGAPGVTLIERTTPPSTPTQIAVAVVTEPVRPPPQLAEPDRPRNARPEEKNVSLAELKVAQAALGLMADGNFGPGNNSSTRQALREFQQGMFNRGEFPKEELTGSLSGQTYEWLRAMKAMPSTPFFGPYERAYLGDTSGSTATRLTKPDQILLDALLADARIPKDQRDAAKTDAAKMALLHANLEALRKTKPDLGPPIGVEPAKVQPGVLDSALFDKVK